MTKENMIIVEANSTDTAINADGTLVGIEIGDKLFEYGDAYAREQLDNIANEVKNLNVSGLTTQQVTALDNMFKACAYTKQDVSEEYNAFKIAFGISTVITTYTVTNRLNNATNSNVDTSVTEGSTYNATITPSNGYTLTGATVTVKMGDVDITSSAYNDGAISISNITGNIEITVTAIQEQTTVTTYTVTNNLTNVTSDNSSISVVENNQYVANLTASSGYTLSNVTVTMDGNDVTSTVYSNGVITISSVTGDIIITASAINQNEIDYTLDALTDVTWTDGYSYKQSSGELATNENHHCTSKFTPQTSLYKLHQGVGSYQTLYEWDENDVFCGAYAVNINSNLYMSLLKTHKYAISIYSTDFDSSLVTLLPVDNSSSAVEQTIIDLSTLTESNFSNNFSNKEINLTSLCPDIGINATNYLQVIQNTNYTVMMRGPNSGAIAHYGGNLLMQIHGFDSIAETISYLQTNKVQLIIN